MSDFQCIILAGRLRHDPRIVTHADRGTAAQTVMTLTTLEVRDGIPYFGRLGIPIDVGGSQRAHHFAQRYRKGDYLVIVGRLVGRAAEHGERIVVDVDHIIDVGPAADDRQEAPDAPHAATPRVSAGAAADGTTEGMPVQPWMQAVQSMLAATAASPSMPAPDARHAAPPGATDPAPHAPGASSATPLSAWDWDQL